MDTSGLYDGLELPKQTKREREEEETKQQKNADLSTMKNIPVKRQKRPLDLAAMMAKLEGYMLVDTKFAKASALFCQLVSDQLTPRTSELFLKTLTKVINEKGETLSGRKEFQTLIETLDAKRDTLLSTSDEERKERKQRLETWTFLAITHAQLFTDETYQFNKAAKAVKLRFEAIVSKKDDQKEEERARRLHIELMPLLRTLYSKLGVAWATTIVEGVLALATRYRLLFRELDRLEVDSWTKGMQERRRAPAILRSAGSDARRNIFTTSKSNTSEAAQQLRMFATKKKTRLTWRQKAKIEERRRNPPPPRQQPRTKVQRQNFLISPPLDDGKKWRVLSAGVLERLPIIQPDLKDWEMDFEVMLHEKALREDQRLEEDFWFMEPGTKHITPEEAPWPNEEEDPDEIVGAGFHLAPRETEDDANNNRKSLNRALKGRVFLLVKNNQKDAKYPWFFPVGDKQDSEKMREAALRHVNETVGDDLEATPVGFGPMGYVKYLHESDDAEYDGTKIFFYKSQHLDGDVVLNQEKAGDYLWVTRDELSEYLEPEIADYIQKMVPP
ncbi:hypothetical protein DD237_001567 [Peronospora effusa]|uniref:Uncharacterized protein n=1 Tax=Peronospora effusa TaxID=542832 RepID=A0A425CNR2_9STRA|nr:hypothetical protein DD237_001567 [Peronospora effusa]